MKMKKALNVKPEKKNQEKKEWIEPEILDFDVKTETAGQTGGALDVTGGYS